MSKQIYIDENGKVENINDYIIAYENEGDGCVHYDFSGLLEITNEEFVFSLNKIFNPEDIFEYENIEKYEFQFTERYVVCFVITDLLCYDLFYDRKNCFFNESIIGRTSLNTFNLMLNKMGDGKSDD